MSTFTVQARGMTEVRLKLSRMKNGAQNLEPALTAAGIYARDRAVWRINSQGGDQSWKPNKRGGHTGILSGRMIQSIGILRQSSTSIGVGIPGGEVGKYAGYFQFGTGTYAGHSEWTIVPKHKKALAFMSGGQKFVRRSVTMPGQPARPFLLLTEEDERRIRAIFARYLKTGSV